MSGVATRSPAALSPSPINPLNGQGTNATDADGSERTTDEGGGGLRFVRVEVSIGTASGTWFGEIPVCCSLTGSAWLCLDVSPNHVLEAM